MKPNILVFCSWLFTDADTGDFFVEQSELVSDTYNMILVVFKKEYVSIKKLDHNKKSYIVEKRIHHNITVLEVYYPVHKKYPVWLQQYFKIKTVSLLHSYLTKNKIDVSLIHAQSIFDAGKWAYEYYLKYKIPYFITEHNQLTFFNRDKKEAELVYQLLAGAKKICVVSNDKARQFYANGLYFDYHNIGNLVHERFSYLEKKSNTVKRLITIGGYHYLKDQNTIIKALSDLDKELKTKIEFVWIGFDSWGGDFQKEINDIIRTYDFKNIEFILIPVLDRKGILEYLRGSDAFVFSSLSEGMSVSVLEALACGLPVFTSNCGGVDEIIDESNGCIYPIKDSARLTTILKDFISENKHYDSSQISKNIISRFGHEAFRTKLIKLYDELL